MELMFCTMRPQELVLLIWVLFQEDKKKVKLRYSGYLELITLDMRKSQKMPLSFIKDILEMKELTMLT